MNVWEHGARGGMTKGPVTSINRTKDEARMA